MPLTYSINVGTQVESLKKQDINSVLLDLPDNTQKMISPKDVRDAFLTSWSSSAFKQTIGNAGIEYIGIDSGNPSDRDIKQKIYIGKRNYAGLDIMNNYLLSNKDTDIYINNTKPDDYLTQSTTISLLSGTNSNLYMYAPYIKSYTNNLNTSLNLDIINPSINGVININSNNGLVSFSTFSNINGNNSETDYGRPNDWLIDTIHTFCPDGGTIVAMLLPTDAVPVFAVHFAASIALPSK
jgi:hypothetical protein